LKATALVSSTARARTYGAAVGASKQALLCLQSSQIIESLTTNPGNILSTLEVIALKATACYLSRLSFSERKACSGSQLLRVLVQQVLLAECCFA